MLPADNYEHIGRRLRDARLAMRQEIEEMARALHIRTRYLQALEDGAFQNLPGDAYVRGYLAQYARALALDANAFVEAYAKIGGLPQRRFFYIPETIRREHHPSRHLVLVTLALSLALAGLWIAFLPSSSPRLSLVQPPPLPPAVLENPRVKACLSRRVRAFPPCYWQEHAFFLTPTPQPVRRTLMELAPRRTGNPR